MIQAITRSVRTAGRARLICGAAVAALICADAAPALAQDADATDVGELVVTARKREERLRDVPIAASVVDQQMIEQKATLIDTGGIVSQTPGARFNDIAFNTLSEVSLRSSGTARGTNAETGVGLYANGVYVAGGLQFSRNYTRIDFFDLGRAEVLRGTLGALYGRNAVGGAINLIAQQPQFENSGRLFLDYNTDTKKKLGSLVVNVAMSDEVALRFGAEHVDQDGGLYHNLALDEYNDEQHGWIFRGQARFRKGPLDATLLVQNQDEDVGGGGFSLTVPPGTGCPARPAALCYPYGFEQDRYDFYHNTQARVHQDVTQAILTVNYDLGWSQLTSVTSVRRRYVRFVSDSDLWEPGIIAVLRAQGQVLGGEAQRLDTYQDLDDETHTYFQDLHLAGGGGRFTWLAGGEFLRIGSKYAPFQFSAPPVGAGTENGLHYISYAVYGSLGYDLTDQLNLSAEGRYTDDSKDFWSRTVTEPGHLIAGAVDSRSFDATNFSYNLVANWKFAERWIAYAKVGTGYRAGGFNAGADPPPPAMPPRPVQPTFGNEKSTTYEVGAKGNVVPQFYTTVAAYWTDVNGAISQVDNGCFLGSPVCNSRPRNFAVNGGDASLWGVEFEGVLTFDLGPARGTLRGALSRQHGKFKGGDYDGFEVPQTPDWLASANLNLVAPIGSVSAFGNLDFHGQWGGVESLAVGTGIPKDLSNFEVFDLRTGVRFQGVELAVYVENLTNKQYPLLDAATSVRWSKPRNGGVQLRYRW